MKRTIINGHVGFENIDTTIKGSKYDLTDKPSPEIRQDKVIDLIFAPDSTGYPDPSASVAFQHSTDPVVREYISQHLLSKVTSGASVEDADTALELAQRLGESADEYRERIVKFVTSESRKEE